MDSIIYLKCLLYFKNAVFLALGCGFMYLGIYLASDETVINYGWLLPMKFAMPLVYYLMFGVTLLGVCYSGLSILGCWSVYSPSRLLFSLYIFSASVLLIAETAGLISASLSPDLIGLRIDDEELMDNWQRVYAVPGKEQYTTAIDYIQTTGDCCGSLSGKEWTTSWWRLRDYGPEDLVVPLSCCARNQSRHEHDDFGKAYLDPEPRNLSACQNQDEEVHVLARHTKGCSEVLKSWLKESLRKLIYLSTGAIFYQLCLLLSSICCAVHIFTNSSKRTL